MIQDHESNAPTIPALTPTGFAHCKAYSHTELFLFNAKAGRQGAVSAQDTEALAAPETAPETAPKLPPL
jgi:hypothetical protein